MAVAELSRVAHGLGWHGLDARVVGLLARIVREHHAKTQLGEERVPERIVLVHVEGTGDAHGAARGVLLRQHGAVEEQVVLGSEEVRHLLLLGVVARALLAAVAGNETTAATEVVDGELAVVGATAAACMTLGHGKGGDLFGGEDGRGALGAGAVAREERRTVSAHAARDVRTHGVHAGKELESAQGGVAHEGAALDDHLRADLFRIAQFDDLEQGVLNHGVGQARSDVAHRGAFLLRLLHAGVHEHGAAAAQVDGLQGADGFASELLDTHIHGHGEALDEGTAARGAGFVEHDVLDDAVCHAQALHVLTTDVQDELHARQEGLRTAQVSNGLDLARVGLERLDEERLAITRGSHMADGAARGDVRVEIGHDGLGRTQDVAVVVTIPGVEELAVLAHHCCLHGGGTGVQADEHAALVALELAARHDLLVVALLELLVVGIGCEKRVQARHLGALGVAERINGGNELGEGAELFGLVRHGGAACYEEVRVLGHDAVRLVELERDVEALAQLGEILERAAEEGHVATDGAAAREARDGLRYHRLEDGRGHVLLARTLVQERLHVGLSEDATAARDGVDGGGTFGELVQAGGVGVEQRGHLVDERARTTSAGAVHALLDALVEVDDLGVLAAELNCHVRLGNHGLHGALARDDLLHELKTEPLRKEQAAGACNGAGHLRLGKHRGRLYEEVAGASAHVGVVPLVLGIDDLVVIVQHGEFDGGGTHVDA